jgi:predicted  nucleic acid-binding Zn-ribbon protein
MAAAGADTEDAKACTQDQQPETTRAAAAAAAGASGSSSAAVTPLAEAVQKLKGGVSDLETLLQTVMQAAQAERDQIQAEQSQLASQKQLFDAEKSRVTQVSLQRDWDWALILHPFIQRALNAAEHAVP